ncbi:hypothetical protein HYY75_11660 [bacterium]|nr:hypothetical protein [bacterium]
MSSIGGVNSAGSVDNIMRILQNQNEKTLDLTKKLLKLSLEDRSQQNSAEQKGQILDVIA